MPDQSQLGAEPNPFIPLKYVQSLIELTLRHAGSSGPPAGRLLRSIAQVRELSGGIRFTGSTLVSLWGRRDRMATRWRSLIVQHLRKRMSELATEIEQLRDYLQDPRAASEVPAAVQRLWADVASLLPEVRKQIKATRASYADGAETIPDYLSGVVSQALFREAKGDSLLRQLNAIERWAKTSGTTETDPPEIAKTWAHAIAKDWKFSPRAPAVRDASKLKEAMVLLALPGAVLHARQPQHMRIGERYLRRVSRLDEDSRDLLIIPRKDLKLELLILSVKNQAVSVAEGDLLDLKLLTVDKRFVEYDKDRGRLTSERLGARSEAEPADDEDEPDRGENQDQLLDDTPDDSLAFAAAFAPCYKCLTSPAHQLLLREWVGLPTQDRTIREAARRVGISYENAKVQWGKLWKILEMHGLMRPRKGPTPTRRR